ncbi:hypothetical protein C8J56DRAFT_928975, partial [Mycena floridula]
MHIDIPQLLASSSPPTEAERVHLNQLLDTTNDEIFRLTAAINKLVLDREALRQNVASYQAILASIRRLPEDMLREIFVRCLPSNKAANTMTTEAPLLLGLVCRSWREISLTTPALWASIHVRFFQNLEPLQIQRLSREAQAWIARSGTCPLTVELLSSHHIGPPVVEFVESLTRLATRWCQIRIEAPAQALTSLKTLSKNDVPRLEEFSHSEMTRRFTDRGCDDLWESLDILAGNRLRDLGLCNIMMQNLGLATSKVNFGQLTRLNLVTGIRTALMSIGEILARCLNLVTCDLSISSMYSTAVSWNFPPITLLHLLTLDLNIFGYMKQGGSGRPDELEEFISAFMVPRLSSFKHTLPKVTYWVSIAQRSAIENLTMPLMHLASDSVLPYLRSSTIKRLKLDVSFNKWLPVDIERTESADLELLMAIDNEIVCPFLEVLELDNFCYSTATFVDLVKQRAGFRSSDGTRPLKVVHATFLEEPDRDVLSQLDDLVASGLSLSVIYHGPKRSNRVTVR